MNRRGFLLTSAGVLSAGATYRLLSHRQPRPSFTGAILGASHNIGHQLREGKLPPPSQEKRIPVVIVGGGISGLSAAWKLDKAGFHEFELLELEAEPGGNARFGENHVTPYPWGAHYVPIPTPESRAVRELFEELGVIEKYSPSGQPIFHEKYLCFSPQERLYIHGKWQEGLLPTVGVTRRDLDQYERFKEIIRRFSHLRGADGRKAFAIPMEFSSRDPELLALDRISMKEFLENHKLDSIPLHWFVNYACRDDYGSNYADVSAWAGIHYFASRSQGRDGIEDTSVVTWPEGNGWIVRQLQNKLHSHITTNALVFRIKKQGKEICVDVYHPKDGVSSRICANDVVFACPTFLAKHLLNDPETAPVDYLAEFQYAPWLVANLTLRSFPSQHAGSPISWDNVIYDSGSLGYVVATHQSLRTHLEQTVFTYYYALTGSSPAKERNRLLETNWKSWADYILKDLSKPHPDIYDLVSNLDIIRWGHAMIRPRPGFVWGEARQKMVARGGSIHFAHSDLSGFSLFEEAQYRGIRAAEQVLRKRGVHFPTSL